MRVADPPENREEPHLGPEDIKTVYSVDDAWEVYLSHVAVTMASEIDAWVPWSIRFHGPEQLRDLLDGTFRQFVFDRNDGTHLDSVYSGYLTVGSVVPSHAAVAYRFMHDNDLIGASPRKTIARVIEWSKRMWHGVSIDRPQLQEQIDLWQYPGLTPVSRITAGSIIPGEYLAGTPMLIHMTPGCFSTSDMYVWILPRRQHPGAPRLRPRDVRPHLAVLVGGRSVLVAWRRSVRTAFQHPHRRAGVCPADQRIDVFQLVPGWL